MFKLWITVMMTVAVVQGQAARIPSSTSATTTAANSSTTAIPNWIHQLPPCAMHCLMSGFMASNCSLEEPVCLCTNEPLLADMSACVQISCSTINQEIMLETEKNICQGYPVANRAVPLKIISIIFVSITLPIVLLRGMSRWFIAKQLGLDDWVIFLAATLLLVSTVMDSTNISDGFGRHIWTIDASDLAPLLKFFWVGEILYVVILSLTKISILLFYHRIFVEKWFLACVKITICFIVFYAISFVLVLLFQCHPISGIWNRMQPRECLNLHAIVYSNAALSIFQDFLVLVLPVPELLSLQVSVKKKIGVLIMFSVGIFAFTTSCIRLNYLVSFNNSLDTSWDDVDTTIWSLIELNVSIICACLPALRALSGRFLPELFRSSTNDVQYCYSQKDQGISRGTKNSSRFGEDFITIPESIIENNYRDGSVFRNNDALHTTSPLSVELELTRIHIRGEGKADESDPGAILWSQVGRAL